MCGRYGLIFAGEHFEKRFKLVSPPTETESSYNIAPMMMKLVVTRNSPNTSRLMRLGLVPFWAKDPRIGYKMINAGAETAAFQWDKSEKARQPFVIQLKGHPMFAFARL